MFNYINKGAKLTGDEFAVLMLMYRTGLRETQLVDKTSFQDVFMGILLGCICSH